MPGTYPIRSELHDDPTDQGQWSQGGKDASAFPSARATRPIGVQRPLATNTFPSVRATRPIGVQRLLATERKTSTFPCASAARPMGCKGCWQPKRACLTRCNDSKVPRCQGRALQVSLKAGKPNLGGDALINCCQCLNDHSFISSLSSSETAQQPQTQENA